MRTGLIALLGFCLAIAATAANDAERRLVELGRALFFEPALSADGATSCASCHQPAKAFSDGLAVSRGTGGKAGTRNTPSLMDVAANRRFFWDGRGSALAVSALDPLFNPVEHGLRGFDELRQRIAANSAASRLFAAAYARPVRAATETDIGAALAAYLGSLVSADSPFDRYFYGRKADAMSAAAVRGFELFRGAAGCADCHRLDAKRALLTDHEFHALGIGLDMIERRLPELASRAAAAGPSLGHAILQDPGLAAMGRFVVTRKPSDIGKFRTPMLRNVALTAPYMHDGSAATLEEAIEFETSYRNLSQARRRINISAQDKVDLAEFLRALTSDPASR